MKKVMSIIGWCITGILFVCLLLIAVARFSGDNINIFGFYFMNVATPSMEPEIKVGDCVIVKKVDLDTLKVGDDISYNGLVGDYKGKVITHRIQEITKDSSGEYTIITKGTANKSVDPEIKGSQVVGKVIKVSSFIGNIQTFFASRYGFLVLIIPLVVILVCEGLNFKKALHLDDEDTDEEESNE